MYHTVMWTFNVPAGMSRADILKKIDATAHTYLGIPGLIRKYYALRKTGREVRDLPLGVQGTSGRVLHARLGGTRHGTLGGQGGSNLLGHPDHCRWPGEPPGIRWRLTMAARFDPGLAESIRIHEVAPMDSSTPLDVMRAKYTALAVLLRPAAAAQCEGRRRHAGGPGRNGSARIYRPRAGRLPVVMYFHGGGFMLGSPDAFDSLTADLAADVDAVVVSVDYRLTPEHRFPAAFDDSLQAVPAIAARADELDSTSLAWYSPATVPVETSQRPLRSPCGMRGTSRCAVRS